ncbi:MAG TPA: hypothetical protein VIM30_12335 [Candidatus Limnocylindrales bacterium]
MRTEAVPDFAPPPEPAFAPPTEPALAPPAEPLAEFVLPSGRQVVGRGFDLSLRATQQLRPASLYIGLLLLGLVGPAALLGAFMVAHEPAFFEALFSGDTNARPPDDLVGAFGILAILTMVAFIGAVIVAVEAGIIAVALLGGQDVGRPLSLREGIVRSRQVFWRLVGGSIVVGVWLALVDNIVVVLLGHPFGDSGAPDTALETTAASLVAGLPFVYFQSGIVLGDAGAFESLRRSIRLARARWRLALVIGLFSAASGYIELFGLGAGGDILSRLVDTLHLSLIGDPGRAVASGALLLVAIVALGSLLLTVAAIVAAPQVVAFVGLTHYSAGLDLARQAAGPSPPSLRVDADGVPADGVPVGELPAGAMPVAVASPWNTPVSRKGTFHWVTRPMLLTIGLSILLALGGVANLTGTR